MLHNFVNRGSDRVAPLARALRQIAFPLDCAMPPPLRRLIQRLTR